MICASYPIYSSKLYKNKIISYPPANSKDVDENGVWLVYLHRISGSPNCQQEADQQGGHLPAPLDLF